MFKNKLKSILRHPENVFVIFSLLICLITSLIIPPLSHSDPGYHISKSYLMFSNYNETPEELRLIPPDVKQSIIEKNNLLTRPLEINDGVALNIDKPITVWRYDFNGGLTTMSEKASITDLGHLPQALGILLVRTLTNEPSYNLIYYTGVLFNWLVSTALIFLSIKFVRKAKWAFFVVATIPTITFLSCGLGYDALTNAICLLFFSIIFNLFTQKTTISRMQLLALVGVGVGAVLTKQTNALLLIFIPFIPTVVYKNLWPFRYIWQVKDGLSERMKRIILSIVVVVVLCIVAFASNKLAIKLAVDLDTSRLGVVYEIIKDLFRSIFRQDLAQLYNPNWQRSSPDGVLRTIFTYKVQMPFWVILIYAISILGVFIKSAEEVSGETVKKLAIISTSVFCIITISIWLGMMFMYTGFTEATGLINGVQGRYFSAYLILLLPGVIYLANLLKIKIGGKTKHLSIFCIVLAFGINVYSLYLMQAFYYLNL